MNLNKTPYVQPLPDHYTRVNEREWTPQEVTDFIVKELGSDIMRPVGLKVMLKRELSSGDKKTLGGIIIPGGSSDLDVGKIIDFGESAFKNKDRFEMGCPVNRGDLVRYAKYQYVSVGKFECLGFEIVMVYDDKIEGIASSLDALKSV